MTSSLSNFRTYQLSLQLYAAAKEAPLHGFLRDQLLRAASSICLNLAEGSAKPTVRDRARFYRMALGSLREVQAVTDLEGSKLVCVRSRADTVGAHLYRLCKSV